MSSLKTLDGMTLMDMTSLEDLLTKLDVDLATFFQQMEYSSQESKYGLVKKSICPLNSDLTATT